jgi:hypothetical protein
MFFAAGDPARWPRRVRHVVRCASVSETGRAYDLTSCNDQISNARRLSGGARSRAGGGTRVVRPEISRPASKAFDLAQVDRGAAPIRGASRGRGYRVSRRPSCSHATRTQSDFIGRRRRKQPSNLSFTSNSLPASDASARGISLFGCSCADDYCEIVLCIASSPLARQLKGGPMAPAASAVLHAKGRLGIIP